MNAIFDFDATENKQSSEKKWLLRLAMVNFCLCASKENLEFFLKSFIMSIAYVSIMLTKYLCNMYLYMGMIVLLLFQLTVAVNDFSGGI